MSSGNPFLSRIFGSRNQRLLRRVGRVVERVNALEKTLAGCGDAQLQAATAKYKERAAGGEPLEDLMPEAFAVVREAARRTLQLRHFDVQIVGGAILHGGKIAEMKTGEGKTLVATLPAYLNALSGEPVHIVTVNDYLARRDAEWMGAVYSFLGLSVGVVASGQNHEEKKQAYAADIVYGTNNEFGFDYLRDNMAFSAAQRVQRGLHYAIVDEVDSILIDEARTPLIISGPAAESTDLYHRINDIVPRLTRQQAEDGPGDYSVDEKSRQVFLTEEGHERAEQLLAEVGLLDSGASLYDVNSIGLLHHLNAALRAHALFSRDVDYIVKDGQIVIIDEFTGRMMPGRRWSEGLHQAVEAREKLKVNQENQTLASITFQNYFRLYRKLAGMTGTADTEAAEFQQIYGLEVAVMPTHMKMVRDDLPDLVYRTAAEKFRAIIADIKERQARSQPVLVGTVSIEVSEYLSRLLGEENVRHSVLNAKHHESEAQIVAQAGGPGTVTIATNMAGRGTDIVLGGNLEKELAEASDDDQERAALHNDWQARHDAVVAAGGLYVLSTERHESRRVDNQLRGRSGRQGDPGASRFYLSMEDNLMRIFGSEKVSTLMEKLGMEEGEAIEHPWVTRAIENAQRKVEGRNFDMRKQLLEYDDVANEQRKVVYGERSALMEVEDISQNIKAMRETVVNKAIDQALPPQSLEEQWDIPALESILREEFSVELPLRDWLRDEPELHEEPLRKRILAGVEQNFERVLAPLAEEERRRVEKAVTLNVLDQLWKEHLANMDHLRQGIHLRGYAQKNPKQEYKRESFELFTAMLERVRRDTVRVLSHLQLAREGESAAELQQSRQPASMEFVHPQSEAPSPAFARPGGASPSPSPRARPSPTPQTFVRSGRKIGRNEPCPCGSGKKFKQCHGQG